MATWIVCSLHAGWSGKRNVKTMWLLERLIPDFKTIADFRKDNGKGIKKACRQFVELCRQMNMFTDAVVATNGSKFKAVNAKKIFKPLKTWEQQPWCLKPIPLAQRIKAYSINHCSSMTRTKICMFAQLAR